MAKKAHASTTEFTDTSTRIVIADQGNFGRTVEVDGYKATWHASGISQLQKPTGNVLVPSGSFTLEYSGEPGAPKFSAKMDKTGLVLRDQNRRPIFEKLVDGKPQKMSVADTKQFEELGKKYSSILAESFQKVAQGEKDKLVAAKILPPDPVVTPKTQPSAVPPPVTARRDQSPALKTQTSRANHPADFHPYKDEKRNARAWQRSEERRKSHEPTDWRQNAFKNS